MDAHKLIPFLLMAHSHIHVRIPGDSEIDELYRIFRLRGTPNEEMWPGITSLKDWSSNFPKWHRQPLETTLPTLCSEGVDLLGQMIEYDPARRISAKKGKMETYAWTCLEMNKDLFFSPCCALYGRML